LGETQILKSTLEAKAQTLRDRLHELRGIRPKGWQEAFMRVQDELIEVVAQISKLERRIRVLVEDAGAD
jgi:hypothetical protein